MSVRREMVVVNGFILFVLFAAVITAGVIAGKAFHDKLEKEIARRIDGAKSLGDNHWLLHNTVAEIDRRLCLVENPPIASPPSEQRLCPECDEEKEITDGDYLCSDCRAPETDAA
jgi:hypothetical protein